MVKPRPELREKAVKACVNLPLDTEEGLAETIAVAAIWQTDRDGLYVGSRLDADTATQIARFILAVKEKQHATKPNQDPCGND